MTEQTMEGVRRVETIGATVRGQYGELARITSVLEYTRASASHIVSPLDVVVTFVPVGPAASNAYSHGSSWASDLELAEPGDVGAHIDRRGYGWTHVRASWQGGRCLPTCDHYRPEDTPASRGDRPTPTTRTASAPTGGRSSATRRT